TRSLNVLLATRGLGLLTARSLRLLTTRRLDILTASASQRPRRLNILAPRSLRVLTSAGQRARRLDILSLGDLGEHLFCLLDLGRAGRLSVHCGRQGAEHCRAHDRCEKPFHRSPVPPTLLRCGVFSLRLLLLPAGSPPFILSV